MIASTYGYYKDLLYRQHKGRTSKAQDQWLDANYELLNPQQKAAITRIGRQRADDEYENEMRSTL